MSVPKKDVDPATDLVEEDDEQSLPELETAVDLAAGAGPLAAGRAAILRDLLAKPQLFHTPHARTHWEAPARANVERELDTLEATAG